MVNVDIEEGLYKRIENFVLSHNEKNPHNKKSIKSYVNSSIYQMLLMENER